MSSASLYAIYMSDLARRFCQEVKDSDAHRETIDSFGLAIAPFDLGPSIYIGTDGKLSLTATCRGDEVATMRQLIHAGYEVGVPTLKRFQYDGQKNWGVAVAGNGIEFSLHITKET